MTRREFIRSAGVSVALGAAGCKSSANFRAAESEGVRFKLGLAGGTYWQLKDYSFLEEVASLDLHYLSVKDWHLPFTATDAEIGTFLKRCEDLDISPYAVGPVYMDTEDMARRTFDYAAKLGVKTIVGVPFVRRDVNGRSVRFENRGLAEKVAELCKRHDVRFAIHNHGPDAPELFPDAKSMYVVVKDLGPRMGFCLDVGHEFRFGGDPAAAIRAYPDRIFDVHMKNVTAPSKEGKAAEFPRGKMDIPAILLALRDIGFDGVCAIEWERGGKTKEDLPGLAESVGYFRGAVDALEGMAR